LIKLERLRSAKSLIELAPILGFTPRGLSHTLYKVPEAAKYVTFDLPKKGGGTRQIHAPIGALKLLQRNLSDVLYACRAEIEEASGRRPLSHGFRHSHSIITNAELHKRRRFVLNLDLENFFPTFNFGRVRGFFIKDKDFRLEPKVATIIAQIACRDSCLPQGSPCSPVISDLIGHILDVRLVQLAKRYKVTYSRYADDITFSTNQKAFPPELAHFTEGAGWVLGDKLVAAIAHCDFTINPAKTRMQVRGSRQVVTGLTVNEKVNVSQSYYRTVRSMCHALFQTGSYVKPSDPATTITQLEPLEGMLSHVYHVKQAADLDEHGKKKPKPAPGPRYLYEKFLFFKLFVCPTKPLIVCEGKTDKVYLRLALRFLKTAPANLLATAEGVKPGITLYNCTNKASRIVEVTGGSANLANLIGRYGGMLAKFKHKPLEHPVIILIDNDSGASPVFGAIKKNTGFKVELTSKDPFYYLGNNLYLVKTPELAAGGTSCIESFFDDDLKATVLNGKKFNAASEGDTATEYGKHIFAERVVTPAAKTIDWTPFEPLLERISAAISHYQALVMAKKSGLKATVAA
jgi:hypothetical protein